MVVSCLAWARRPGVALRLAIGITLAAILWFAPIYFAQQWPAAQAPLAPWHVALVRKPFFAGIMMFTYAPAYMPSLYAIWALAVASWINLVTARRRRARDQAHLAAQATPAAAE